jgi:hypothetical protein
MIPFLRDIYFLEPYGYNTAGRRLFRIKAYAQPIVYQFKHLPIDLNPKDRFCSYINIVQKLYREIRMKQSVQRNRHSTAVSAERKMTGEQGIEYAQESTEERAADFVELNLYTFLDGFGIVWRFPELNL